MNRPETMTIQQKKKKRGKIRVDDLQLFALSLPTTIWYLLFCYIPMFGILIAFKKYKVAPGKGFLWSLIHNSPWCGLDNFKFLFSSNMKTTVAMFRNTVGYNIVFIVLNIVIPVALAILISHLYSKRLAKVCQTAIFLPHFLSWVVVGYFVYAFLATNEGLVNNVLISMGINPIRWYQKEAIGYWPFILVFLNVWKNMGYNMIVYMASINGIDGSLYEAAVKYPHTLRLIALGPLTNVATAFSKYPDLPGLLHSMLIMGGAAVGGNVTPAAEFNIYCDPEAAELVFDSGVHIVMCGLDGTLKALLRPADWDELAATGTRAGKFVRDCVQCAWQFSQKFGLEGVAMHDSCPVLYLAHPELFRAEEAGVKIETRSTLTLGKTVTDLYSDKQFDEKNATVVLDVDRDRFIEILKDCIKAI